MEQLTIKKARMLNEKTQDECAEFLGISRQAYISKEQGETRFYFDEVIKLCEWLNVDWTKIKPSLST